MREIKFRAWDISGKQMLNWPSITTGFMQGFFTGIYDVELMEYTGKKDRNKKEIYEGDIIKPFKSFDVIYVVEFFKCGFICKKVGEPHITIDLYNIHENCEVIGNIYEHPHLLAMEDKA